MEPIKEEIKKDNNLVKIDVSETPFTIIGKPKENYFFIVMGNNIVSDKKFESSEEAKEYIEKKPTMLILTAAAILAENIYEQKKKGVENA